MTINKTDLVLSLGYLIGQILNGDMDNPCTLARTLQVFADKAWDDVDQEIHPNCLLP
jgi:hypothetical protein